MPVERESHPAQICGQAGICLENATIQAQDSCQYLLPNRCFEDFHLTHQGNGGRKCFLQPCVPPGSYEQYEGLGMIRQVLAVGLIFAFICGGLPVQAGGCASRDQVVERLKTRYSETFTGGGLQASRNSQTIVEVWSSKETGTFTVLLTTPEGLACVVATGTDWFQAAQEQGAQS